MRLAARIVSRPSTTRASMRASAAVKQNARPISERLRAIVRCGSSTVRTKRSRPRLPRCTASTATCRPFTIARGSRSPSPAVPLLQRLSQLCSRAAKFRSVETKRSADPMPSRAKAMPPRLPKRICRSASMTKRALTPQPTASSSPCSIAQDGWGRVGPVACNSNDISYSRLRSRVPVLSAMRISQRMVSRSCETRAGDREAFKAASRNSDHLK